MQDSPFSKSWHHAAAAPFCRAVAPGATRPRRPPGKHSCQRPKRNLQKERYTTLAPLRAAEIAVRIAAVQAIFDMGDVIGLASAERSIDLVRHSLRNWLLAVEPRFVIRPACAFYWSSVV
jgi:hypothetical protein